ncbi:helix-turn-helix domain-containing protein [Sulfuricella sp.]
MIHLPGSLKAWAAEMNLAHETLYRTLNEMEARGLIERQGQILRLLRNA